MRPKDWTAVWVFMSAISLAVYANEDDVKMSQGSSVAPRVKRGKRFPPFLLLKDSQHVRRYEDDDARRQIFKSLCVLREECNFQREFVMALIADFSVLVLVLSCVP